jgi:hypothetical protein
MSGSLSGVVNCVGGDGNRVNLPLQHVPLIA